jgi:hypothetical protein
METTINIVDAALSIADVIEAVAAFSQRSDVRKFTARSQQITQGLITVIALASIVMICLSLGIAQAIYREWKAIWPIAVAAFHKGYDGELSVITVIEALDKSPVIEAVPAKPSTAILRSNCKAAGIKWRNVHGKNKHLTVAEMRIVLERTNASIERASKIHAA